MEAKQSGITELKSFAQGIRRDYAAVRASFASKWSNGPVEGQLRLRQLKRAAGRKRSENRTVALSAGAPSITLEP